MKIIISFLVDFRFFGSFQFYQLSVIAYGSVSDNKNP